jgi:serine/threonine protein kinase
MPPEHTGFVIGERIPGTKYVLCGVLGKGGMGVVYDVVKEPGIRGAMKVMYPSMVARPDCVARFFDEVSLLANLRHRNIVAVQDFDRLRDGTPFLVMEKLEGETLRGTLRKSTRITQGFPARGAYEVIRQTCEALYRAHTQPIAVVHRDIKPENLFLNQIPGSDEVEIKVLDFGVAALVDGARSRGQFGTPKYMAPEQFRGEAATPKADLYAIGLVLYELLTGRLPWDAQTENELYHAHTSIDPAPPSRFARWVPASVDALLACALAKDPAARPHSAFAFASQLYELQWVDDGRGRPRDVNTTAPTLTSLVSAVDDDDPSDWAASGEHDTIGGMTPPPIEGAAPEGAGGDDTAFPRDTLHAAVSAAVREAIARGAEPGDRGGVSSGETHVPSGPPSHGVVDRSAPTREQLPRPRPRPRQDTAPLSTISTGPLGARPTVVPRPAARTGETASPTTAGTASASTAPGSSASTGRPPATAKEVAGAGAGRAGQGAAAQELLGTPAPATGPQAGPAVAAVRRDAGGEVGATGALETAATASSASTGAEATVSAARDVRLVPDAGTLGASAGSPAGSVTAPMPAFVATRAPPIPVLESLAGASAVTPARGDATPLALVVGPLAPHLSAKRRLRSRLPVGVFAGVVSIGTLLSLLAARPRPGPSPFARPLATAPETQTASGSGLSGAWPESSQADGAILEGGAGEDESPRGSALEENPPPSRTSPPSASLPAPAGSSADSSRSAISRGQASARTSRPTRDAPTATPRPNRPFETY